MTANRNGVRCLRRRTGRRLSDGVTNISLHRLGDGHSADQHDPDRTVGYVEEALNT